MTVEPAARRFFVETWGCQMNELDSQRMAGQLMQLGLLPTRSAADADLILLNSCSVREKAEQKVYSQLGRYRALKATKPELKIGLCGCVAQQIGERALARVAELDLVLSPARVGELDLLLPRVLEGERIVATGFPEERRYDLDSLSPNDGHKGMVTVIEGCDKRCTFCIVPSTRGPERSRPLSEIVCHVEQLLELGYAEIELLGQTVNHWRDPELGLDFADLLDAIAPLSGLRRLRFLTSFPRDFTPRMVERFRLHPILCDSFHLPVQSGSDRVLRRMGRGYTVADYLALVHLARATRPTLALSTDLIVGFPGETDSDFEATLQLVEQVRFSSVFAFRFSPRPGTAAVRLPDPVPDLVAEDRLQRLLSAQDRIQHELAQECVGRTFELVVTGSGSMPGYGSGRTSCNRIVHFECGNPGRAAGDFVDVRITGAQAYKLDGELLSEGNQPGISATDSPRPRSASSLGRLRVLAG